MGRFANLSDTPEGIEDFKTQYNIPPEVTTLPFGGLACSKARRGYGDPNDSFYKGVNANPHGKGDKGLFNCQ